jgi:ABC-type multidrug transport system permease subunit
MAVAGVDTAEAGGNAANLVFSLTLLFCGVLAAPSTLGWWVSTYMSFLTPLPGSYCASDLVVPPIAFQLPR